MGRLKYLVSKYPGSLSGWSTVIHHSGGCCFTTYAWLPRPHGRGNQVVNLTLSLNDVQLNNFLVVPDRRDGYISAAFGPMKNITPLA